MNSNMMSWIDQIEYAVEYSKKTEIKLDFLKTKFELKTKKNKIHFLNHIRKYVKTSSKPNF